MDFKGRAKTWDNENMIRRAEIVANKIEELVGKRENSSVMEYGCATGLISFNLVNNFKKLTLIDSEKEMIDVVKEKIEFYNVENVNTINTDLIKDNNINEKFDIIYTSMTLHHILDIEKIVKVFYDLLNENGILCVIELDKEDGRFHINEKNFNGHNGFEHTEMNNALEKAGFKEICSETFFHGEKKYQENIIPYSMFYSMGRK